MRVPLLNLLALALSGAMGCNAVEDHDSTVNTANTASAATYWHAGNFRMLPSMTHDLVSFVSWLDHPSAGGYGKVSSTRAPNFTAFLDMLFTATKDSIADGDTGDWCGVQDFAASAGYAVRRFYDLGTGRWFVYAYDTTQYGQAYFFINPFAKRNIVVEVPHEPYDESTAVQGARIFTSLAARALLINKEHRCSDPDTSICSGTSTACGGGGFRESDVAHHTQNTFHLLHTWLSDHDPTARFFQLHGMSGARNDMAEVADSTAFDVNCSSVSVTFANNLTKYVPTPTSVYSCQQFSGDPPSAFCAETNVQGRYTNNPTGDACMTSAWSYSGRFLALEQAPSLRDEDDVDGWYWGDVRDALRDTWPDCNMNNGATDCTLGAVQTQYSDLACP